MNQKRSKSTKPAASSFLGQLTVQHVVLALVLSVLTWLSYQSVLSVPMFFDSELRLVPKNLLGFSQSFKWTDLWNEPRVMSWLTYALNFKLWHMDVQAFRAVNLCLHAANAVLLYLFLNALGFYWYGESKKIKNSVSVWSFFAALMFALNPMSLYSVVYIIQRNGELATFFSLLSGIVFLKGMQIQKLRWYLLSVLFYFLSVQSKEHILLLPFVWMSMFFLFSTDFKKQLRLLLWPIILFSVVGLHAIWQQKHLVASVYEPNALIVLDHLSKNPSGETVRDTGMYLWSVFNQLWYYFEYLYLWVVPDVSMMAIDVPAPFVKTVFVWPQFLGLVFFLAYGVLCLWMFFKRKKWGLVAFALVYPLILFGVELSAVRFHENFVLYRSYLWVPGLYVLVLCLGLYLKQKEWVWQGYLAAVIYLVVLVGAQQHRLKPFQSGLLLWEDVIQKIDLSDRRIPSSYRSAGNYATGLGHAGRIDESIRYFKIAADLNANYVKAWDGIGAALALRGDFKGAVQYLEKAIQVEPSYKEAYFNLGTAQSELGNLDLAMQAYEAALKIDPNYISVLYNLGNALLKSQRADKALVYYKRASLLPGVSKDVFHNMGIAYGHTRDHESAIQAYQSVLKIDPNHAKANYNLGNSLAALKRFSLALQSYQKSLILEPDYLYALHNTGLMLVYLDRSKEAVPYFKKVLTLNPGFTPSKKVLDKMAATNSK